MMIDMDCACGCGQQTPIAKRTRRPRGQIKGQPMKFVNVAHASLRQSDERLWGKVTKHSGDGCWLWMGAKNNKGYGVISVAGRLTLAHRLAWELAHHGEPIQPGLCVCHKCDVRACARPSHLFLDTIAGNNEDMVAKGRHRHGPTWKHLQALKAG